MVANPIKIIRELPHVSQLLILGTLINSIGILIGPFLSLLMINEFHLPMVEAARVLASFAAGTFVAVVAGGWLADRYGYRAVMLFSLIAGGGIALALGFMHTQSSFVPLLFAFGFSSDLFRPASMALLTETIPSSQRPLGFAALRVATNLGFSCAAVLGGFLLSRNWRWIFWLDGLSTLGYGWLIFSNFKKIDKKPASHVEKTPNPRARGVLLSIFPWDDGVFVVESLACLLLALVFITHLTVLPLTITQAGYSPEVFGALMAANGLAVFGLEMILVKNLGGCPRMKVAALGTLLIGTGLGLSGLVMHWAWFGFTVGLWTLGEMLTFSFLLSFHSDWAPPGTRGQYVGMTQASFKLAQVLSPLILLPLYGKMMPATFWALTGSILIPVALIFFMIGKRYDHPHLLRGPSPKYFRLNQPPQLPPPSSKPPKLPPP